MRELANLPFNLFFQSVLLALEKITQSSSTSCSCILCFFLVVLYRAPLFRTGSGVARWLVGRISIVLVLDFKA